MLHSLHDLQTLECWSFNLGQRMDWAAFLYTAHILHWKISLYFLQLYIHARAKICYYLVLWSNELEIQNLRSTIHCKCRHTLNTYCLSAIKFSQQDQETHSGQIKTYVLQIHLLRFSKNFMGALTQKLGSRFPLSQS